MKKEINCMNTRAFIDYVKVHNRGDSTVLLGNLDPEIDNLPDPEKFLMDHNNWISSSVMTELWKRGRTLLKDDMLGYNVARYAIENTSFGYAQKIFIKAFWSHRKAIKNAQEINDKWNRSKVIKIVHLGRNSSIIRLHWVSSMDLSKDMCLSNRGAYTFFPIVWGGKPLTLVEKCCFFDGAPYCEYHLSWSARNNFRDFFSRIFSSKSLLMDTLEEIESDKKIIAQKYEEVYQLNAELKNRINQIMAIQETGKAILSILDLDKLLSIIINLLSNVCKIDRALIMLMNDENNCLEYLHGMTLEGEIPPEIKNYRVSMNNTNNMFVRVASNGLPEYIPKINESNLKKEDVIVSYGKPVSAYIVPLSTSGKVVGVIAIDGIGEHGVPKDTRESLDLFAPHIAIAIENARLYSELEEQMQELKKSHSLISRAERFSFLGHLAARLAHEIKNPLTAIETFLQMFPQKHNDEKFKNDFYKIAVEETKRVNSLISELLDLVKKKESRFEYSDIHLLIDKMILLISPQTKNKKIEVIRKFSLDIGLIKIDPEKMKQTILNLLINAIEFTPEEGKIEVRTFKSKKEQTSGTITIVIEDNGIGIPESMVDKIFDPYHTTKHKSSHHSGTGLGLFIAYQNIEDHGGTIEVKSKINEGTTFTIELPFEASITN